MKLLSSILISVVISSPLGAINPHQDRPSVVFHEDTVSNIVDTVLEIGIPQGGNLYGASAPGKKKSLKQEQIKIAVDGAGNIMIDDNNSHTSTIIIASNSGKLRLNTREYSGIALVTTAYKGVSIIIYNGECCGNPTKIFAEVSDPDKMQKLFAEYLTNKQKEESLSSKQTKNTTDAIMSPEKAIAYNVRVLLEEQTLFKEPWLFSSDDGFLITDPCDTQHSIKISAEQLRVYEKNGSFYLNNKKFLRQQVLIKPKNGYLTFNGNSYKGSFLLLHDKGKALLINNLDLEDYVVSVLKSESWPGWPLEVNKVCAIASRTYAIGMVKRSHTNKLPYHIKNTNAHQVYQGVDSAESEVLKKAVKETRGVFLAYKGTPILAMFDSCCGGVIPAHIRGFNFSKAPYLARPYACTHCKPYKVYTWQARYTGTELLDIFKQEIPSLKKIKQLKIIKKDKAGLVEKVAIHSTRGTTSVTGKKIYSLLPKVKSFCFSITKEGDSFVFKGKGYGHHIGLCQWGARGMVSKGFKYKDILQFYYPKTTFMRLS